MRYEGMDYAHRERDVLAITLPAPAPKTAWERLKRAFGDDGSFEISVLPPTKRAHDALSDIAGDIDDIARGELAAEEYDTGKALEAVATVMSNNLEKREITREFLESVDFDLEDVGDFIGGYVFFVTELVRAKN